MALRTSLQHPDHYPRYYRAEIRNEPDMDKGYLVPRNYAGLDCDNEARKRRVEASNTYFNVVSQIVELMVIV